MWWLNSSTASQANRTVSTNRQCASTSHQPRVHQRSRGDCGRRRSATSRLSSTCRPARSVEGRRS
jgi:hypothetical protein